MRLAKTLLPAVLLTAALSGLTFAGEKDDRIAQLESEVADLQERVSAIEALLPHSGPAPAPAPAASEKEPLIALRNESGSTEDGITPIIYTDGNPKSAHSMGLSTRNLDGSLLSFIYVDGVLQKQMQLADTDASFYVTGDILSEGTHTVTVTQYDGNDEKGSVLFTASLDYEVQLTK